VQVPVVDSFTSTVINKLDAKGRVSIPAPFRQLLTQQGTEGVYCIANVEQNAIDAFGKTMITEYDARHAGRDALLDADYEALSQLLHGESHVLMWDEEGRVRLPDVLIELARIEDRVCFVGLGRKFQMWNPERFEPVRRLRLERARQLRVGHAL
jgi:MraZ protein